MNNKEAKDVLLNYTCCCKYGTSPINCSDEECDFGKAIKTLCNKPQGEWIKVKENRMSIDMSGEIVTRYKCSKCGRLILTIPSNLADYPFCHCGADMRGDNV